MDVDLSKGAGPDDGMHPGGDAALRMRALESLKKKADFRTHLLMYVLVNGLLVLIWAMTGASFFWPAFPMGGWAIGLIAHAWDVYWTRTPTEAQVAREMNRLRGAG
ncbi:2TM domain-containing protein [Sinomonas atrocyanea]|uniref:2TM domain-containing protein n=1 Tax=Sinomonas atrocyanea TaxID=37927 RepID=UPI003D9616AA